MCEEIAASCVCERFKKLNKLKSAFSQQNHGTESSHLNCVLFLSVLFASTAISFRFSHGNKNNLKTIWFGRNSVCLILEKLATKLCFHKSGICVLEREEHSVSRGICVVIKSRGF